MDHACFLLDEMLAPWITHWRDLGYDIIVTADHGWTRAATMVAEILFSRILRCTTLATRFCGAVDEPLDQLQLAPTILSLMNVPIPETMKTVPSSDTKMR